MIEIPYAAKLLFQELMAMQASVIVLMLLMRWKTIHDGRDDDDRDDDDEEE